MNAQHTRLPRILQWTFVSLEALAVLLVLLLCAFLFAGYLPERVSLSLGEVQLELPRNQYTLESGSIHGEAIAFDQVRGTVEVANPDDASGFLRAIRVPAMVLICFVGIMAVSICELFRRLFRNVALGSTFAESNVRNLHKIGFLILVLTVGGAFLGGWTRYQVANYMEANLEATGVVIDFAPPSPRGGLSLSEGNFLVHFDLAGILAGLILLALGEAFRQGLALKEDHDLTV